VVVVVFAVRGDSYAGFGEVRGGEVVHRVGCLCMCGWVVGCAEVLRSGVVSEEGFGCVAHYLRAWRRRRKRRWAAWKDCGAPEVEVEVGVNS
jgi:hypothetical protein